MEAATFYDDIQNPDRRPMAMAVTLIPDRVVDYDPEAELHSEGFLNLASYRSETVDSLIEELAASHEDADRERIFGELQRAVARDVPSLYIAYSPRILAVAPGLQGVEVDVRGPFASLEDWRISR
jgi:ABC-type transport system substrate-binding protein